MKPIKLIISAIGPYAKQMPEINFEQFDEKGLFLISGDTGAGKTTIFDAICYALYGKTSGTFRDTKNLRSEYAKDDVKSYVDFYFSHQGKQYHVYRQPCYERKKQRGEGMITEAERAVFHEEGATPIEGLRQVNDAVKALLKIDDEQFKQIAMIAQGEFWNLLNAGTEQRTVILRTIFNTESYKQIEYKLKERKDASYGRKLSAQNSIIQYFDDVVTDGTDEAGIALHNLKDTVHSVGSVWNVEEMLSSIERYVEADEKRLKTEQEALAEAEQALRNNRDALAIAQENNKAIARLEMLTERKKALEEQKKKIDDISRFVKRQKAATRVVYPVFQSLEKKTMEINGTHDNMNRTKDELQSASEKAEQAATIRDQWLNLQSRAETLKVKREMITKEMPKYQERDVLNKHLEELKQEQFAIDSEIRKWQTEEQKLNDRIEALRAQEEVLRGKPEELHTLKMAEAKRKVLADKMKAVLEMQLPRYHKLDVDYRAVQPYYTDARHNYEVADNVYQDAERTLEGCRAGLLAQNLKEGKMCPVCGSLHHPQPAVLPSETVTEEELKKLKAERDKLCEIKDNALAKVEKAKAQYEQYEGQFVQALLDCLADAGGVNQIPTESVKDLTTHVQSAYAAIQAKLKEDAAFISSLEQACRVLEQTRDALDIAQTHDKEQLISSKALLDQKKQNVQSELAADSATLRTLQNLSYPDFETAKRTAKAMSEKVDEITKGIQRAEEYKKYVDSQVDQLSGMLTTLKKTLEEQKADETELKEQLQRAMLHTAFSTQEEMRGFVTSEEDIAKTEEEINNYQQDVATNNEGLKQAEMDAAGKRWVDVESLETICQEQTEANAIKQKIVNEIENRIHNNREKHNNIQVQRGLYESAEKENNICNRLYNLVKGTTVNGKITLEQYIQAAGFDGIIAAANRRLLPMSDGQYELYRQEGPLGKRSNTFLDLEVLDNYTGHRRPVGNLSGGESFKASLSLALGLSDTVSSNLGGIQMDALFIDEGFGTLDRKSIDSAMDILNNLSGANKLVGVISHREELVENISQQIRVKKTKDGSNFSVELGL